MPRLLETIKTIMLDRRTTFIQNLKNANGQVALFVALIFQILFLFFAMVINVGLLVHHKINLQNSVDLAAYYGAMKQAENMNAIAHMNYQVRQSWKLLAWRYRMIGSAGEMFKHPYNKTTRQLAPNVDEDIVSINDNVLRNFQEAPSFCITYVPFKPMPDNENTCRRMSDFSGIQLFEAPPVIASHQLFSEQMKETADIMRRNTLQRCVYMGSYNYMMLAKFVVAFNLDQKNRMDMMAHLSRSTSLSTEDFYDLDGQSVRTGIEKTLSNNLTTANRSALGDLKIYNSLGADGCNAVGVPSGQPAKWLKAIRINPGFNYIDTRCAVNGNRIDPVGVEFSTNPNNLPYHYRNPGQFEFDEKLRSNIMGLLPHIGYKEDVNDNYNFSIGVEKNPWCMAYTGVSVESTPKIPFSPFGGVRLKARAFYKPFGGRIGPWYTRMWAPGSETSNTGGKKTDELLPPRFTGQIETGVTNTPEERSARAANFSRFVGDQVGLKSFRMLGYYGKAIYELDPRWRSNQPTTGPNGVFDGDDAPSFEHWNHLPDAFVNTNGGGNGDILAWNSKTGAPSAMRRLELAAVAPDLFDISYYSIEPDYYNVYYKRIRDGYLKGPGKDFTDGFRPDIGYHKGYRNGSENYEEFSVRKQMAILGDADLNLPVSDKFTFTVMDWKNLLTGWAPKSLSDYSLDPDKFGKCSESPLGSDNYSPTAPTSGNCIAGGSTGYAVKMISSDFLRSQDLVLGGEGAGSGPIKNPPPPDGDF